MPTLRDGGVVAAFVTDVQRNAFDRWTSLSEQERGEAVVQAAIDALQNCGVPRPARDVRALAPGYLGFFNFGPWALQISSAIFAGDPHPDVAETVYHEARHCEQWYCMARFHGLGKTAAVLGAELGIRSPVVCTRAVRDPMRLGDPLLNLTKAWFESVYGRSGREITLTALALRQTGTTLVSMDGFHDHVHATYSGGLPEEVDAWGIQLLVRESFQTLFPPLRPLPITAAQWKIKTARTGHTRSLDLSAVDSAMAAYEIGQTHAALAQLRTRFSHWYGRNPKEAATRNVDQCITRLKAFLGV